MTTTPKQHGDTPPAVSVPVYRHSSETARSNNDAGGKVPPSQYEGTAPKNG
ncbi:hypothetical protein [Bradyrhizobium sp.]|uniref:hypothetical protein n=1 Tax=Bradyrhizobium sp. TaxID=376 RepID=UPI002630F33F|nr:hypothetical protein [Bradyrhizobium sp.]